MSEFEWDSLFEKIVAPFFIGLCTLILLFCVIVLCAEFVAAPLIVVLVFGGFGLTWAVGHFVLKVLENMDRGKQ